MAIITYKTILAEAISGYNDIQEALLTAGKTTLKYTTRNNAQGAIPTISSSNGVVSHLMTANEMVSAIGNMAVISTSSTTNSLNTNSNGFVSGVIAYKGSNLEKNADLTFDPSTRKISISSDIPQGYYPGNTKLVAEKTLDAAGDLEVSSVAGSTVLTPSTNATDGYFIFTANNLNIKAYHKTAGWAAGGSTSLYTDADVDNASVGKIAAASVTKALNNAGSIVSVSSSLNVSADDSSSGITVQALAPANPTVTISAGYIKAGNYSVSGSNSPLLYITGLTVGSGNTLSAINNQGTITTIKNNGTSSTVRATMNITTNSNGTVVFGPTVSGVTNNYTRLIDNATYVGGTSSANGTKVTNDNNQLVTGTGSVSLTGTQTIGISSSISLESTDDTTTLTTTKNIKADVSTNLYDSETAVKDAKYEYFLAIKSTPTGGTTTLTADASITKNGWMTTGYDFTSVPKTVTASGSATTKYLGVNKAILSNSKDDTKTYANGGKLISLSNKTLYINAGYITDTYITLDIPDIDKDANASNILEGTSAYNDQGVKIDGSMPNKGAQTYTITSQGGTYTIPLGYHNGNGVITAKINDATWNTSVITEGTGINLVTGSGYTATKSISKLTIPKDVAFTIDATADTAADTTSNITVNNKAYRVINLNNVTNGNVNISSNGGVVKQSFTAAAGDVYIRDSGVTSGDGVKVATAGKLINVVHTLSVSSADSNSAYLTTTANSYKLTFTGTENVTTAGWHAKSNHTDTVGTDNYFYIQAGSLTHAALAPEYKTTNADGSAYSASDTNAAKTFAANATPESGYVTVKVNEAQSTFTKGWIENNPTAARSATVKIPAKSQADDDKALGITAGGTITTNTSNGKVISNDSSTATKFTADGKSRTQASDYQFTATKTVTTKDYYMLSDTTVNATATLSADATGSTVDDYLLSAYNRIVLGADYADIFDDNGVSTV